MEEQVDILAGIEEEVVLEYATVGQRFANYLIDLICLYAFAFLLGIVLGLIHMQGLLGNNTYISNVIVGYILSVVFYTALETLMKGRTIGKLVTGTVVVKEDGSALTFQDVLIRSFSRIPFYQFSAFGGYPWHDRWSHTRVVKVQK